MIELLQSAADFVLHVDRHLAGIIAHFGVWTYGIIFLIVFAETGLVLTPFLPGDSLLFAAGAFCARPDTGLDVNVLALGLFTGAVLGDTVNYWIGARVGPAVFKRRDSILLRQRHLERAHEFFDRYGGRAIIFARFVPIVRTFVPFLAGIGRMRYRRFILYNIVGGFAWVYFFTYAGFFFGNQPLIQENFKIVILAIIVLSVLPILLELVRTAAVRPAGGGRSQKT